MKMKTVRKFAIPALQVIIMLMIPVLLIAQPDLSQVADEVEDATADIRTIVNYVLGSVVLLGLIWVIYAVVTNHPKARESVIGLLIAIAVWAITFAIL